MPNKKFTKEIKNLWLENLQNGKFKALEGELVDDIDNPVNCCCLGVLGVMCKIPMEYADGSVVIFKGDDPYNSLYESLQGYLIVAEMRALVRLNDNYTSKNGEYNPEIITFIKNLKTK